MREIPNGNWNFRYQILHARHITYYLKLYDINIRGSSFKLYLGEGKSGRKKNVRWKRKEIYGCLVAMRKWEKKKRERKKMTWDPPIFSLPIGEKMNKTKFVEV